MKFHGVSRNYGRVRDHCHYTGKYKAAAHSICNSRHKRTYEIPVVYRNVSNYDYHFTIKQLVEEFEEQLKCPRKNSNNQITFSVPIETQENQKIIKHKIRFIEHVIFMNSSLSSLINTLAKGLYKVKCKDCKSSLEYVTSENGLLVFKCVECNTALRASKTRTSLRWRHQHHLSHITKRYFLSIRLHRSLRENQRKFITNKEGILICYE